MKRARSFTEPVFRFFFGLFRYLDSGGCSTVSGVILTTYCTRQGQGFRELRPASQTARSGLLALEFQLLRRWAPAVRTKGGMCH